MPSAEKKPARETCANPWDRPWGIWLGGVLLALCLFAAYHHTFQVPYLLDDADSIEKNPSIRSFATALFPPKNSGITAGGRPLLNLSLAVNYRLGGTEVIGYHVGNLLIHFAAALCLFGVVRRTLKLPALVGRFGTQAMQIAWFTSALWALHPMQTESVTYIIQRAESLVGLCYLLTLYAFIRSMEKPSRLWPALTFLACVLGMAAKEVMASAPIVLFLYDRTFVSGTFRESWRRHRWLHVSLASTWLLLLALVISSGGRGSTVGFASTSWLEYALTQGPGITTYLMHSLVPVNLVFDYGAIIEKRPMVIIGGLTVVISLLVVTVVLLKKRPAAGFLGACFFLILAPTSSIIPVATQTLAEHRMYLPLAAVAGTIVLFVGRCGARYSWGILSVLVIATGFAAIERNKVYQTNLAVWEDTVRNVPDNTRALNNLGTVYMGLARYDDAIRCFREAIDLCPGFADPHGNLGATLMRKGLNRLTDGKASELQLERSEFFSLKAEGQRDEALIREALGCMSKAVELEPTRALLRCLYGNALLDDNQLAVSLPQFEQAVALAPDEAAYHYDYANVLAKMEHNEEAVKQYVITLRLAPDEVGALTNYGALLRRMKRFPESIEQLRKAVKLKPEVARIHSNLGVALLASGQRENGMGELVEALRLNPKLPQALYHLGNALAQTGRTEEAIRHMETLLEVARPTAELLSNLGVLYARVDRLDEAVIRLQRALEMDPNHSAARDNLTKINAYLQSHPTR